MFDVWITPTGFDREAFLLSMTYLPVVGDMLVFVNDGIEERFEVKRRTFCYVKSDDLSFVQLLVISVS